MAMKGDASTHTYSRQGVENHEKVKMNYEPVGPCDIWKHRITGSTMKLPVGVTGGKNWEKVA
jgi:hypothetical protein